MTINKKNFLQMMRRLNLENGKKVLVSFSGGPDSMAMLHLLTGIQDALKMQFVVMYIDHNLRDISDDLHILDFIKKKYPELPVHVEKIDVLASAANNKYSVEEAARILRYQILKKRCDELGCSYIVTGHHLDDFAETVLMHLLEGTGLSGLAGIRLHHHSIIRPMLLYKKSELLEYCRKHHLPFAEDHTNRDIKYKRNKIRHKLIPFMEKYFQPSIADKLSETGLIIQREEMFLNKLLQNIPVKHKYNCVFTDQIHLKGLSPWGLKKFLEEYLFPHVGFHKILNFAKFTDLIEYIQGNSSKKIPIQNGYFLKRDREQITVSKHKTWKHVSILDGSHPYKVEGLELQFQTKILENKSGVKVIDFVIDAENGPKNSRVSSLYLDCDDLQFPLTLRPLEKEDHFKPLGLKYTVKVNRYLKDKGVFETSVQVYPVIANNNNEMIALPGFFPADHFRVKTSTKKIMEFQFFNFFHEKF